MPRLRQRLRLYNSCHHRLRGFSTSLMLVATRLSCLNARHGEHSSTLLMGGCTAAARCRNGPEPSARTEDTDLEFRRRQLHERACHRGPNIWMHRQAVCALQTRLCRHRIKMDDFIIDHYPRRYCHSFIASEDSTIHSYPETICTRDTDRTPNPEPDLCTIPEIQHHHSRRANDGLTASLISASVSRQGLL